MSNRFNFSINPIVGGRRAGETVTAALINHLLRDHSLTQRLDSWLHWPVMNVANREIGQHVVLGDWLGG